MAIEEPINKALKQVDFKSRGSGNGSGYVGKSSARSDMTCHKCGKRCHTKKDCRSKGNVSGGIPPKKSANELPEWVNKKLVVSYNKYLATDTMTFNKKKYKLCTSYNNRKGEYIYHWKDGHEE